MSDPEGAHHEMVKIKKWITATFTRFYIGAVNVLIIFLVYLYFSKYSDLKLGKDDEKPEFSTIAMWFNVIYNTCMLENMKFICRVEQGYLTRLRYPCSTL